MQTPHDDVIAAIATPIGEGSISVIRLSGAGARSIADMNFRGRQTLSSVSSHTAHFGSFFDAEGNMIDQVVATVFLGPHSYTGQDTVEISCHGGMYVTQKILESVFRSGARPARAGEFTQRAFLNGRMDLSQAEAVADLIRCRSDISHKVSVFQLQGKLSSVVAEIRQSLVDLCAVVEIGLDFPEEDIEVDARGEMLTKLNSVIGKLQQLSDTYNGWRMAREGVRVALVGRPNVGKSSILNSLIDEDRAIVTSVPGTTRDVIEENTLIGGMLFTVVDTAGFQPSSDVVEIEGMRRSEQEIKNSDLLMLIVDASVGVLSEDIDIFERIKKIADNSSKILLVANKIDLGCSALSSFETALTSLQRCKVSAKSHAGLSDLKSCILAITIAKMPASDPERSAIVANARHKAAIERATQHLRTAQVETSAGLGGEFVAATMRLAIESLGEIIGSVTTEDILEGIFSKFCIGK